MKLTRPLVALVAALLAALLAAGCGGPTKEDYEQDVRAVGERVEEDLDKLGSEQPSPADIEKATDSIEQAADDIEEVDAPEEVEKLHGDLVSTLRDTADILERLSPLMEQATDDPASMGEKELEQMNSITSDFSEVEQEMDRITKGFEKKDYDIGLGNDQDDKATDEAGSGDDK